MPEFRRGSSRDRLKELPHQANIDAVTFDAPQRERLIFLSLSREAYQALYEAVELDVLEQQRQQVINGNLFGQDTRNVTADIGAQVGLYEVMAERGLVGGENFTVSEEDTRGGSFAFLTVGEASDADYPGALAYLGANPLSTKDIWVIEYQVQRSNQDGQPGTDGEDGKPGGTGGTGSPGSPGETGGQGGTGGTGGTGGQGGRGGKGGDGGKGSPGKDGNDGSDGWNLDFKIGKQPAGQSGNVNAYTNDSTHLAVCLNKPRTVLSAGGNAMFPVTPGNPVVGDMINLDLFNIGPILDAIIAKEFPGCHRRHLIKVKFVLAYIAEDNIDLEIAPANLNLLKPLTRPPRIYFGKSRASVHADWAVAGPTSITGTAEGIAFNVTYIDENFVELEIGSDGSPLGCTPLYFDLAIIQVPGIVLNALAFTDRSQVQLWATCIKVKKPSPCENNGNLGAFWTPDPDPTALIAQNPCWNVHPNNFSGGSNYDVQINADGGCWFFNSGLVAPTTYLELNRDGKLPTAVQYTLAGTFWDCGASSGGYGAEFTFFVWAHQDYDPTGPLILVARSAPEKRPDGDQEVIGIVPLDFSDAYFTSHPVNECTPFTISFDHSKGGIRVSSVTVTFIY